MPRHSLVLAAAFAMIAVMASARPALAAYGAFAYDEATGKYGVAWNEDTESRAREVALKDCKSPGCKIVMPVGPHICAALATAETGTAWGGVNDRPTKDAARL